MSFILKVEGKYYVRGGKEWYNVFDPRAATEFATKRAALEWCDDHPDCECVRPVRRDPEVVKFIDWCNRGMPVLW